MRTADRIAVCSTNESPYRAAPGCAHSRAVETTCDYQPETDYSKLDFVIRLRTFECADCGVGVWPANEARAAIPRAARCTRPACECLGDACA